MRFSLVLTEPLVYKLMTSAILFTSQKHRLFCFCEKEEHYVIQSGRDLSVRHAAGRAL